MNSSVMYLQPSLYAVFRSCSCYSLHVIHRAIAADTTALSRETVVAFVNGKVNE